MADSTATATPDLDADEKIAHEVKIEDIGPAKKRLTITVPADAIAEKLSSQMDVLMTETALPGFRKGRAPKSLMQKRFGSAVRTETRNQIVSEAYAAAIEENSIKPVGDPEPVTKVDDLELKEGEPLEFQIDVEVVPDFDVPALDGIEVKKPKLEITEDHIGNELKRQQIRFGSPHKVEGDFKENDRLTCYAKATRKGEEEEFFAHDEVLVLVPGEENDGRGQVLGLLIDKFAKKLAGKAIGDSITIETTVPENHEREDIRGKDITIELQIRHAERIEEADLETIAKSYGMESVDVLREQVTFALEQRRDQEQAQVMRQQVLDHLTNAVDFELPEKLSSAQAARVVRQRELELLYEGLSQEEIETRLAEFRAESESIARNRLKLFFVLHKLAEQFGIEVTEQEINGRIAQIAVQRGVRPEVLRNELARDGRVSEIAMQIRDQKVADRIVGQAKVQEISAEEWQKELDKKQPKAAGAGPKKTTKKTTTKKKTTKKA